MAAGSGAAYSMNSNPSVPIGFADIASAEAGLAQVSIQLLSRDATRSDGGVRARPEAKTRKAVGHAAQSLPRARQPPGAGRGMDRVLEDAAPRHAHPARPAGARDPAWRAAHALRV